MSDGLNTLDNLHTAPPSLFPVVLFSSYSGQDILVCFPCVLHPSQSVIRVCYTPPNL